MGVTHVPVSEGWCLVVPTEDLDDRSRFALWCRAYWSEIFDNERWRDLARRHFAPELAGVASGKREALGTLLAECPPAASLPEVAGAVARAVMRFDAGPFRALGAQLAQREKAYRKGLKLDEGVHSLRPTPRMRDAVARSAATGEDLFGDRATPSVRARITRSHGVAKFEDSSWPKATEVALNRMRSLARVYPRAVTAVVPCRHRGKLHALFEGAPMSAEEAPRLVLNPIDDGGQATGEPLFVLLNE